MKITESPIELFGIPLGNSTNTPVIPKTALRYDPLGLTSPTSIAR
jgi:hypothetical protein